MRYGVESLDICDRLHGGMKGRRPSLEIGRLSRNVSK